jgi:endonuclease YncB( thermonuclease family)
MKAPIVDTRDMGNSEPWAMEAKEFLRKKLVGKKVQVEVEYRKNIASKSEETKRGEERTMEFASVF